MARKSLSARRKELEEAQKRFDDARDAEATRVGRIALDAGFDAVDVDDGKLKAAFKELADRFRNE